MNEVRAFAAARLVPAERTLEQTLEDIANCVRVASAAQPALDEWLNEYASAVR